MKEETDGVIERLVTAVLGSEPDEVDKETEEGILNALADYKYEVIVEVLKLPGMVDAALAGIPAEWEYNESIWGDNPTKKMFAVSYILEQLTTEEDTIEERTSGEGIPVNLLGGKIQRELEE